MICFAAEAAPEPPATSPADDAPATSVADDAPATPVADDAQAHFGTGPIDSDAAPPSAATSLDARLDPRKDTERLGDEIAELAAHIHAATYRLLVLLEEFDRREGWEGGFRSCAHWLSWRTGIGLGAAREKMRVARALPELPLISAAMERGELSYSKARALTRVATPANESELMEFARQGTTAHVERLVRAWRRVDRNAEAELERVRHRARSLTLYPDDDGSWVVRGRLDPEVGALFRKALEAAADALYREERVEDAAAATATGHSTLEQADQAAGRVPERATHVQRMADALGLVAERALASEGKARRADRFQVVLHVDEEALRTPESGDHGTRVADDDAGAAAAGPAAGPGADSGGGQAVLAESGQRVSAETSRRLSCDASLVRMSHDAGGDVLDVGRRTRTVPPAIRRALEHRDRTCRFPGCAVRHADAHHIIHWADGGETKLGNLLLLCQRHHRAVHEGEVRVEKARTRSGAPSLRFYRPDGRPLPPVPAPPRLSGEPVLELVRGHGRRGVRPDSWTPTPLWHGERWDLGMAVAGLRAIGR